MPRKTLFSTLLLMWLGHFLIDFMIGIWPIYKTLAQLDLAVSGMIAALCAFIGEGMQLFFGPLSDRGWRRKLLVFSLLAVCASAFLTYTNNYAYLLLLCCLTSIGSGAFHPSAVSTVSKLTKKRKGLLIGLFSMGGALGMASSHFIYSKIWLNGGHTIILTIPLMIIFAAFCIWFYFEKQTEAASVSQKAAYKHNWKDFFAKRELIILYAVQVCIQSVFWGTIFLLPDALHARGYESWLSFGVGSFVFLSSSALMMIPGGYLADKYSPKQVLVGALIIGCGAFFTFIFNPHLPEYLLLATLFFAGSALGLTSPVIVALANRMLPDQPGLVSAAMMGGAWCLAECLGPGGSGMLTYLFTNDAPASALGVIGIALLAALWGAQQLPTSLVYEQEVPSSALI